MVEFIAGVISLATGSLLYRKRFVSKRQVGGLYFLQLWYLLVAVGVVTLFINLGFDVITRPQVTKFFISSNVLFNLYILSLIVGAMGVGIHSTSTSVYQSFKHKGKVEEAAFNSNQKFHGPLSHNMIYVGAIIATLLLGLLELNHPYTGRSYYFNFLLATGILMGGIASMGVLWSGHLTYSLITSFISSIIIGLSYRSFALNINSYPFATIALAAIISLFCLLLLASLIFLVSASLSHKVIKRTFPKGHPYHEALNLRVLRIKIEREWF